MNKKRSQGMTIAQKVAQVKRASAKKKPHFSFVRELKEEMRKVSWTSKGELQLCTKIVVGSIIFLGFGIYTIDLVLRGSLEGIARLTRLITG